MRVSPSRLAVAVTLGAWAAVFWFLLATGRWALYLSSRTQWVVPLGAIVLTAAALGRALTMRAERPEALGRAQAWGLGVVLIPVVTVLALPPAALGSFAASRRSVSAGFVSGPTDIGEKVTLVEVAGAMWSDDVRRELIERAGSSVDFTGIVTRREGMAADEFVLTRFIVSCCVADALSVQVRVVGAPTGKFEEDEWVRVTGRIYPLTEEVVVDAVRVTAVPRPDEPYLSV